MGKPDGFISDEEADRVPGFISDSDADEKYVPPKLNTYHEPDLLGSIYRKVAAGASAIPAHASGITAAVLDSAGGHLGNVLSGVDQAGGALLDGKVGGLQDLADNYDQGSERQKEFTRKLESGIGDKEKAAAEMAGMFVPGSLARLLPGGASALEKIGHGIIQGAIPSFANSSPGTRAEETTFGGAGGAGASALGIGAGKVAEYAGDKISDIAGNYSNKVARRLVTPTVSATKALERKGLLDYGGDSSLVDYALDNGAFGKDASETLARTRALHSESGKAVGDTINNLDRAVSEQPIGVTAKHDSFVDPEKIVQNIRTNYIGSADQASQPMREKIAQPYIDEIYRMARINGRLSYRQSQDMLKSIRDGVYSGQLGENVSDEAANRIGGIVNSEIKSAARNASPELHDDLLRAKSDYGQSAALQTISEGNAARAERAGGGGIPTSRAGVMSSLMPSDYTRLRFAQRFANPEVKQYILGKLPPTGDVSTPKDLTVSEGKPLGQQVDAYHKQFFQAHPDIPSEAEDYSPGSPEGSHPQSQDTTGLLTPTRPREQVTRKDAFGRRGNGQGSGGAGGSNDPRQP